MELGTAISLIAYFLLMLGIGLYACRAASENSAGYLLGGRRLSPSVTALSAGASDMSGWMVMGFPGALYLSGLANSWIAIGVVIGAWINYLVVAPRLRIYTEIANDSITLPEFFENRFEDKSRSLRIVSSIVIIIFFTVYTSSGVVAGGKLFESSFGLSYELGLAVTAGVVVAYTLFGGFLAVSLTDFVQGCIMFLALVIVPAVILFDFGGYAGISQTVASVSPSHLDIMAGMTTVGLISSLSWGLGYFGQPHIVVRFMAIRSATELKVARRVGMSWMIVSLAGAMATGFFGYAYVLANGIEMGDPETIFIVLSQLLFHPLIGGFMLAAILAAIMSTLSSQLLVTSSSLTEDIYRAFINRDASEKLLVLVGRLSVVLVALIAIVFALNRDSNVLSIVANAWAGFGAAFGPLVIFSLYWKRMTFAGALAGIIVGAVTVLVWVFSPLTIAGTPLGEIIYEIVPGVLFSSLAIAGVSLAGKAPSQSMRNIFDQMVQRLQMDSPQSTGSR